MTLCTIKNLLFTLAISTTVLYAESIKDPLVNPLTKTKPLTKKEKLFIYDIDLSYHGLSRSISTSSNGLSSSVNDILHINFQATILPESYDIELNYVKNLTNNVDASLYNPQNLDSDTESIYASMIPWYDNTYGGLGVFYSSAQQNSQYFNNSGSAVALVSYTWDSSQPSNWNLLSIATDLSSGQGVQVKEKAAYTGFKYLLPQTKYLPKGSNVYYSTMNRSSVYFATFDGVDKLIYLSGTGTMYGLGIQRSLHELPTNELTLDLVQLSKGAFSGFPAVALSEYTAGATYKAENWFIKGLALIYVAEEFSTTLNSKALIIPQQTDIFYSLSFGLIY